MKIPGYIILLYIVLVALIVVQVIASQAPTPNQSKNTQTPAIKNCSGSWPDPTWTSEDFAAKRVQLEKCRELYGAENEGKTWN